MNSNVTLTVALLVGGESRRMGKDKATLELDGEPLWSRQLRVLRELIPEKLLVSARAKPRWCPADVEVILDEASSCGPLGGLVATLKKIHTTHLLILAVDMPRMTTAHLEKLWSLAQPGRGVIPQNGNSFEPLCAIYPVEALAMMDASLLNGDLALQPLVQRMMESHLAIHIVDESEEPFYRNVNVPSDLNPVL